MRFDRLVIQNVRNLADVDIRLCAGLNHFYGYNGAGKTAVLEAVHLLCRGRSFRSQVIRDLVRYGEESLLVRAVLTDEQRGELTLGLRKYLNGQTEMRLDGQKVLRVSDVARLTPLQTLLPDISELVFAGPRLRRSWLDWGMFHVKPEFLPVHRDYLRVLKQRNACLRNARNTAADLAPWNAELVELSGVLTHMRREYLGILEPVLNEVLLVLIPELAVQLDYLRGWPADQELEKLLGERHSTEVKSGVTQWGPHRAEIRFLVGGRAASKVLSRGQGKLLATAMKVAQVALLNSEQQRASVFLIDDAGAELDSAHGARFFGLLRQLDCQIISTSVQKPDNDYGFPVGNFDMFHVKHGTIAKN